jgi:hypothetical protein
LRAVIVAITFTPFHRAENEDERFSATGGILVLDCKVCPVRACEFFIEVIKTSRFGRCDGSRSCQRHKSSALHVYDFQVVVSERA